MSFYNTIAQAARDAQSTLAQLGGAVAGVNNVLLAGTNTKCIGVFGAAIMVNIPVAGGGYRQRAVVPLTITQDQLGAPPAAKSRIVRLDVSPPVTYIVDFVNAHGNLDYTLMLVKMGE